MQSSGQKRIVMKPKFREKIYHAHRVMNGISHGVLLCCPSCSDNDLGVQPSIIYVQSGEAKINIIIIKTCSSEAD